MKEKKQVKKRRLKPQVIFNLLSILFCFSVGGYYLGRLIYYKMESEKPIILKEDLKSRVLEQNDTYELRSTLVETNGVYRFVGDVDNNYVRYQGYVWRIVRINEDGSITMVTEDTLLTLPYGNSLSQYILRWLNTKEEETATGIFESGLEEAEKLLPTTMCVNQVSTLEASGCFETDQQYKIGILSLHDYLEANANESYLNNETEFWTSNRYDEDSAWFVAADGTVGKDDFKNKHGIRPVITISGDSKIIDGIGTSESPYLLSDYQKTTLQDIYVGSYIQFQNGLWKVVSKESGKIKIVSENCIQDKNGECILKNFSEYSNSMSLSRKELLYYLNNTYYNSLEQKEYVVSGNFYTGTYSLSTNDYRSAFAKTTSLKVGMLSIGEPFAYELENTFLLNTSSGNDMSIYSVSSNHTVYENMVTEKLNIRPALYLKSNITITSGDGDYLNPYILGGIEA